jgi:hypothetical protein
MGIEVVEEIERLFVGFAKLGERRAGDGVDLHVIILARNG